METSRAIRILAALAQETRLGIFRYLIGRGDEGSNVGEIAERLDVPGATLSFHLAALTHSGLLTRRRRGRQILYRVDSAAMRDLLAYLTEDCCAGRPEICGIGASDPQAIAASGSGR